MKGGGVGECAETRPVVECFVRSGGVEGVGFGIGDDDCDALIEKCGWVDGWV